MDEDALATLQAPLKASYREDPDAALVTLRASGRLGEGVSCSLDTGRALAEAGLHPAAGGDGSQLCSGDMLLEALVACAGVTLCAVATSMGLTLRGGSVRAEGDLDFRGTLAVSKDAPVGVPRDPVRVRPRHRRERPGAGRPGQAHRAVLRGVAVAAAAARGVGVDLAGRLSPCG